MNPSSAVLSSAVTIWLSLTVFVVGDCPERCLCEGEKDAWTYETQYTADCSNLKLTEVPKFNGDFKVDVLDLQVNKISILQNHAFKAIIPKQIILKDNNISKIEPDAFADVARTTAILDLSSNKLEILPQGLNKLQALKTLDLTYNRDLKISKGSFVGLRSLKKLFLTQCYMDSIPADTFDDIAGTLQELRLDFNRLTEVPAALKKLGQLEKVDFDVNPITFVAAHTFQGMTKLREITLSRNEFSKPESIHPLAFIDVAGTLESLNFYHSDLTVCPAESLAPLVNLKKLSFSSNDITEFPPKVFKNLHSLKELSFDSNPCSFTKEMFEGVEDTLEMISIRRMRLQELPIKEFSVLRHLKWIDAAENEFVILRKNFTEGLTASRYTLFANKITDISPDAFLGKKRPIHLGLDNNNLTSLNFIIDPCDYEYVEVAQNPLVCDCHTYSVSLNTDVVLVGTCAQPSNLSGMDISGVEFKKAVRKICINETNSDSQNFCPQRNWYMDNTNRSRGVVTGVWYMATAITLNLLLYSVHL